MTLFNTSNAANERLLTFALAQDVEQGREAPRAISDRHSSQMPWNLSSAHRSSAQPRSQLGGYGGFSSSAQGVDDNAPPGSRSRRGSRLMSASPLLGRGPQYDLSDLELPTHVGEDDLLGGPVGVSSSQQGVADEDFQLYGPAANVSTQTAQTSQWMKATLDEESSNFLAFVRDRTDAELSAGLAVEEVIAFEALLPPVHNTNIVAAQALYHVLALATKNVLLVEQDEGFGDIMLRIANK